MVIPKKFKLEVNFKSGGGTILRNVTVEVLNSFIKWYNESKYNPFRKTYSVGFTLDDMTVEGWMVDRDNIRDFTFIEQSLDKSKES